jgi:hypothetical protein
MIARTNVFIFYFFKKKKIPKLKKKG